MTHKYNQFTFALMKVAKFKIDGNIGDPDPFLLAFGMEDGSVNAKMVGDFIDANPDADELHIEIESNGGSVTQGFAIFDKLKNSGKYIVTKGYKVNSIATVIFLAGTERLLSNNAEFVIHNPWIDGSNLGNTPLTADELDAIAQDVRNSEDKIFNFYKDTLRLNVKQQNEIKDLMSKDTDLGADRAIELGFATSKMEKKKAKAAYTDAILAKYKSNKDNNMNTVEQTKKLNLLEKGVNAILNLLKPKNSSSTTKEGTTLYFEGDTIDVGTSVFSDEAMSVPAVNGDYTLDNGDVVVVADGVVSEIRTVVAEDDVEKDAKIVELEAANKKLADELEAAKKTSDDKVDKAVKQVDELAKEIAAFKKGVSGDPKDKKKDEKKNDKKPEDMKPWQKRVNTNRSLNETFGKDK